MSTTNTNSKTTKVTISIATTKRAILIALFFTALMTTYMTSISLPQSSFAQTEGNTTDTTNTNQTPTPAVLSLPGRGVITSCNLTDSTDQGPEYKAGPPFRQGQDFAKGIPGQRLIVTGKVVNVGTCKPIQGAVLDIWQPNSTGDFDYKGYNLRGEVP